MKKTMKITLTILVCVFCLSFALVNTKAEDNSADTPNITITETSTNTADSNGAVKPQFGYSTSPLFNSHIITITGIVIVMSGVYLIYSAYNKAHYYY